jgi:hypothetical protein
MLDGFGCNYVEPVSDRSAGCRDNSARIGNWVRFTLVAWPRPLSWLRCLEDGVSSAGRNGEAIVLNVVTGSPSIGIAVGPERYRRPETVRL